MNQIYKIFQILFKEKYMDVFLTLSPVEVICILLYFLRICIRLKLSLIFRTCISPIITEPIPKLQWCVMLYATFGFYFGDDSTPGINICFTILTQKPFDCTLKGVNRWYKTRIERTRIFFADIMEFLPKLFCSSTSKSQSPKLSVSYITPFSRNILV